VRAYQSEYTASAPLPGGQAVTVGARIEHARFGLGTVKAIEGTGLDTKATVAFDNAGQKQLLLRFAKFTIL
jgi:DNA helicase-2/ATP-dependent DNA helicase PcrA